MRLLKFASAIIPTIQGDVRITYDNKSQEAFDLHVVIPANCEAEVWMPKMTKSNALTVNGKRVRAKSNGKYLITTICSGPYHIISQNK